VKPPDARSLFAKPFTVAWQVDSKSPVPQAAEFRDEVAPAPRAMKSAVQQNETHR
jgi:hypothetical protein